MVGGENKKNIWIIANWKSNKTITEALQWLEIVGPYIPQKPKLKVGVCPSFLALAEVKKKILVNNYPLLLGAQDLSRFGSGPYTGEVAAEFLQEVADLVILGHFERRKNFAETDQIIAQKLEFALANKIKPLLCVQNENTPIPNGASLIAYEPIFAIGSSMADDPRKADLVASLLKKKYPGSLEVLYGGSVNRQNAKDFLEQENISGFLVGANSLNPQAFLEIIKGAEFFS